MTDELRSLTVEMVRARIERLKVVARDSEAAHEEEDAIHDDVLRAIAAGADDAVALATEALKTLDIDFSRWYA
jgi:hypothetical protein